MLQEREKGDDQVVVLEKTAADYFGFPPLLLSSTKNKECHRRWPNSCIYLHAYFYVVVQVSRLKMDNNKMLGTIIISGERCRTLWKRQSRAKEHGGGGAGGGSETVQMLAWLLKAFVSAII
jgi:hypothetical protein